MLLAQSIKRWFGKLHKQQVLNSTYSELAAIVAQKYSNKEYKNANTICLHEIQQQHKIISPGDWILDIGAGPHFYWTQLALRLAENQKQTHRVISNDIIESSSLRSNQVYVKGNFLEQQVRTNIGLQLAQRKVDAILVDVSTQFTGNLQEDGGGINQIIFETMYFSNIFLQKGGNFVCKVLKCQSSKLLEEAAKLFFHQFFVFKPSVIRQNSPVQFFVMKGFAMNYEYQAMQDFISRYRGSAKNKTDVVKEYQGKYSWDPVQIIRSKVKNDILGLKMEGRTDRQIESMFSNDPFIKISEIMKQVRKIEEAMNKKDDTRIKKAINQFTEGKLFKQVNQIPSTRQEWINYLQKMQTQLKQLRKKKKPEKVVHNVQPLRDNEVYMKNNYQVEDEERLLVYLQADLQGKYQIKYQKQYIEQQFAKINSDNPEFQKRVQKVKKSMHAKAPLDEVFNPNIIEKDQMKVEQHLMQLSQAFTAISDEEYKKMLQKQGYENEIQQNIAQKDRSSRQKFRNR